MIKDLKMTLTEQIKNKSKSIFWVFVFVLVLAPMWMMFIFNNILVGGMFSQVGGLYFLT